jgi:hypothetical protein
LVVQIVQVAEQLPVQRAAANGDAFARYCVVGTGSDTRCPCAHFAPIITLLIACTRGAGAATATIASETANQRSQNIALFFPAVGEPLLLVDPLRLVLAAFHQSIQNLI